jgi:hypothetical protein
MAIIRAPIGISTYSAMATARASIGISTYSAMAIIVII